MRVVELEAALQQEQAKTASLEEQLKGRAGGGGKRPKKKGGGSRALPTLSRCGEAVGLQCCPWWLCLSGGMFSCGAGGGGKKRA